MGIVLGDEMSFPELISPKSLSKTTIVIIRQVFEQRTLTFAFVSHRFTTYASAIPLWTGDI
ncbi:MAG: hypothetical protein Q8O99_03795 [bacterium]|nr:hypothetical protein [bacterium]